MTEVIGVDAEEFLRALYNASLFMVDAKNKKYEALHGVRFEYTPGSWPKLTLIGTDRHQLCYQEVVPVTTGPEDERRAFTLGGDEVKRMLKDSKKSGTLRLTLGHHQIMARDSALNAVYAFDPSTSFLDSWRENILPQPGAHAPTYRIVYQRHFLTRLGKVRLPKDGDYAVMTFQGALKPSLVQFDGGPNVVMLPTRVSG